MKTGRPSFHIKGRWVVFEIPGTQRVAYKLDEKGNPIKVDGLIQPDTDFDFQKADNRSFGRRGLHVF